MLSLLAFDPAEAGERPERRAEKKGRASVTRWCWRHGSFCVTVRLLPINKGGASPYEEDAFTAGEASH